MSNKPLDGFQVFKLLLKIAAFIILIAAACFGDYYIWRLQHPTAPTWTYFARP